MTATYILQEAQLSQRGRATIRVIGNLAQGRSRSFEITPLSKP